MSARRYKSGWWVDFRFESQRYRRKSPSNTKRGAEKHERELLRRLRAGLPIDAEPDAQPPEPPASRSAPQPHNRKEVPIFAVFATEFMNTYAKANNKKSEQTAKQCHLRCHLLPAFGQMRLDEIDTRQIERFKAKLLDGTRSRKRINNVLATLGRILSYAAEIEILPKAPKIKLLKIEDQQVHFLDFAPYEALIKATESDPLWHAAILLGGDAGLRLGEIRALRPAHWNRRGGRITVQRSLWQDIESATKGWKRRTIPLTDRLQQALRSVFRAGRTYLVARDETRPLTFETTRWHLPKFCRQAGIKAIGWHALRHTFCSHLAMMGVPARTIQELAGHADLKTTLKYMHLVEGETDRAIGLLNHRQDHAKKRVPKPANEPANDPTDDLDKKPPKEPS